MKRSAHDAAQIIRDHIMVADAVSIAINSIQQLNQLDWSNNQPRLLTHFADHGLGEQLANFDEASGQRPSAFCRLGSPLHEQNAAIGDDDSADANERSSGKLTLHVSTIVLEAPWSEKPSLE